MHRRRTRASQLRQLRVGQWRAHRHEPRRRVAAHRHHQDDCRRHHITAFGHADIYATFHRRRPTNRHQYRLPRSRRPMPPWRHGTPCRRWAARRSAPAVRDRRSPPWDPAHHTRRRVEPVGQAAGKQDRVSAIVQVVGVAGGEFACAARTVKLRGTTTKWAIVAADDGASGGAGMDSGDADRAIELLPRGSPRKVNATPGSAGPRASRARAA